VTPRLRNLQRRLERWELEHLRHRAGQAAGRALIDACLVILFLFGLPLAAVWRSV
jgi:hypothetical protein